MLTSSSLAKHLALFASALVLICLAMPAWSATQTSRLIFAQDTIGSVVHGEIRGTTIRDYLVRAKRGQTMKVSLLPSNHYAFVTVIPPGGQAPLFVGESSDERDWAGILPASGGYRVRVLMNEAAARRGVCATYDLAISLR
ncbi:hypothetical protein [Bordetella avium]|uniref:hypothetical protein n=1 Tax=Bordetella avium TaxID=521 RepID=UPI000E0B0953|nr:hypothetical protein [Bordetella avium]RIQ14033.1 hypothetical protein D0432_07120 [Bordetella avium]RIQ39732.1 hypothetical protein D0848_05110 [Bordetella avium]RIQ44530.1 hypothetical protein D0847_05085 [Bordetella avium]RIQ45250.1 hypothetical protein D0846_05120 [Bordetella avium]RIQ51571.1 hypothetical protein D0845_04205 [Bordetella avium]